MSALPDLLEPPPGLDSLPEFDRGWRIAQAHEPFLAYETAIDVNWSADLEALHEESSRTHFIDIQTRAVLVDAVRRTGATPRTIVDLGCSSGYLLEDLRAAFPDAAVLGVDLVAEGLRRAHGSVPEAALVLADCTRLPFRDGSVDAVVSANLLEHVPDDVAALKEIRRILRPGGHAGIVVPAGPSLYDAYDAHLGHERRYGRDELAHKARGAGLEVELDTHLAALLYPPFWVAKKRNRRRGDPGDPAGREALVRRQIAGTQGSRLGAAACSLERALIARGVRLPFGIRSLCVLRRHH
jgi:SAM-dependent methyltransferase